MGECIIKIYREKVKLSWKVAFLSTFIIGLLIHTYKFTNVTPVADSMYNLYNSQNMVQSGRWFLTVACGFSSFFDLPWINGLLSVFFIALTAVIIAEVFEMENPCLIAVSGGLLVSFPAIYSTLGFGFTADGYMIAMFLSALSVLLTKITSTDGKGKLLHTFAAIACICFSCGIYQAYISFSFIFAVCYFVTELLQNKYSTKEYIKWIITQVAVYAAAMAAYFIFWKLCLHLQNYTATTYQGMDQIGQTSGRNLIDTIVNVLYCFVMFFFEGNPLEYGFTAWSALNVLFVISFAGGLLIAVIRSACFKKVLNLFLIVLCLASIPFGCCALMFTSDKVNYHALMMQSACILFIFVGVLWNKWCSPKYSTAVWVLLCAIVFNNAISANIYYKHLDESFKRTQAVVAEINTRIHLLDDGTIRNVCLAGGLDGYTAEDKWNPKKLRALGPWKSLSYTLLSEQFLAEYTDFELSYYRDNGLEYPVVTFSSEVLPFPNDYEFRFPMLNDEQKSAIMEMDEFISMPQWPAADSVRVIGDTIVIKLSNQ